MRMGPSRKMPAQLVGLIWGARPTSRPTSRGLPRLNFSHLQARGFCVDPQLGPGPSWDKKIFKKNGGLLVLGFGLGVSGTGPCL